MFFFIGFIKGGLKNMSFIKLLPTILIKIFFKLLYAGFKTFFRVDNNKVTFASYRYEHLEGNLKYTYSALSNQSNEFNYSFLFKTLNSSFSGKFNYVFHMVKSCYYLAVSRYFIIDDFYFPVYLIKPRVGVEIVQLWHGAGAFKKFGYSLIGKKYGPSEAYLKHIKIHSNYSIIIVSSISVVKHFAEAFNTDENKILALGLPRTDLFFDDKEKCSIKNRFASSFSHLIHGKVVLYAPTFRGSGHYQGKYRLPFDIEILMNELGEDYTLIIHRHPYITDKIDIPEKFKNRIVVDTNPFTINELMIISDMLITDYSSVIFEYSLLNKPIILYSHDLDEYLSERDFYLDYMADAPGPIVYNTHELAYAIKENNFDSKKIKDFRDKFFDHFDGKSSLRVAKLLMGKSKLDKN